MTHRVALADDEPLPRERLARLLKEAGCEIVGVFSDGASLLAWLQEGPAVDALFVDIQMPGLSGMEVLVEADPRLPVVLVTAHAAYTLAAFEHAAFDYILKPVTADRLAKTLARLQRKEQEPPRPPSAAPPRPLHRFPVRAGEGMVFLELRRVSHFEFHEGVVWVWSQGERFRTTWDGLTEVEAAFPEEPFCRIQRHILLRPGTVVGLKPLWGRRVSARVPGDLELEVSRAMTPKLKDMLGA